MAKAYYSAVFEQPAGDVWKIIRDFNNYPDWVHGEGVSEIEQGKSGDTVGGDRAFIEWYRMVGGVRRRPPRRAGPDAGRLVRDLARIAPRQDGGLRPVPANMRRIYRAGRIFGRFELNF
ncbi:MULTISPECIES: hypothetical protein [unclassified Bradyrhizobium]|uniref:hypothetical protein n=1 Tax=unclassified Bradyrhizobium TaxID=2631580 RepID=UPI0030D248A3